MITAKAKDKHGNPVLLFGLSEENLRRLRLGQPIKVDLGKTGLEGYAIIFYGRTEQEMLAYFGEAGLLSDEMIREHVRGAGNEPSS